jgi:hypothetical protein
MRGKKARAIRKAVYGDQSSRSDARRYYYNDSTVLIKNKGVIVMLPNSLRRQYQLTKAVR